MNLQFQFLRESTLMIEEGEHRGMHRVQVWGGREGKDKSKEGRKSFRTTKAQPA